ncbi:helix-turn-helix transcriptional regulator [Streptomyces sp. SAJ15]|uniref:helix-turn-helix transcriptional regulator n=1 Tax=Streptomyces sp. SAJ15 TaxID=2011095 RepID=UPI0021B4304E|nr:helix-turn-helix transcriptional regulator [Streptomyces sp. SAJ15]
MAGLPMRHGPEHMPGPGPAWDVPARDEVERALLAARDLIQSTVVRHRRELERASLAGAGPADAVERLVRGAVRSVSAILSGGSEQEAALLTALDRLATDGGGEHLAVRLLCVPRTVDDSRVGSAVRGGPRREVRVADVELQEALLVDGRVAYMAPPPERAPRQASLVEDSATVRALDLLFAGAWENAEPLADYPRLGGRLSPRTARRILECLCTGHTDEVAARAMRVSLRTYRRYVAELMRELGASSRFQAGARAVELGLLPGRR